MRRSVSRAEDWMDGVSHRITRTRTARATCGPWSSWRCGDGPLCRSPATTIAALRGIPELATPGQISADRLTGMLIKRPASTAQRDQASPAPPPSRQSSGVETSPPPTFRKRLVAAGRQPNSSGAAKRDEAVKPASGNNRPRNGAIVAGALALERFKTVSDCPDLRRSEQNANCHGSRRFWNCYVR